MKNANAAIVLTLILYFFFLSDTDKINKYIINPMKGAMMLWHDIVAVIKESRLTQRLMKESETCIQGLFLH